MRFGVDAHVAAGFMAGINANGVNTGRCRRDLDDEKHFFGVAAEPRFGHEKSATPSITREGIHIGTAEITQTNSTSSLSLRHRHFWILVVAENVAPTISCARLSPETLHFFSLRHR